jgi:DNA-binding transcriptional LysR family regulator
LGARLFRRQGRAMELSETGKRFLGPAMLMSRVQAELEAMAARLRGKDEGTLTVGACAPFVLIPIVAAFKDRFPAIRVETTIANSETLIRAVEEHELDLATATLPAARAGLHNQLLVTQTIRAVVPADHPWAARGRVSITELGDVPCVTREAGSMTQAILETALARHGIVLDTGITFSSREAVKEAVIHGMGVGFVLDREIGQDNRLVAVDIEGGELTAGEYLFCQKDLAELDSVRSFLDVAEAVYPPGDRVRSDHRALPEKGTPREKNNL